jgi:hypothetical protein
MSADLLANHERPAADRPAAKTDTADPHRGYWLGGGNDRVPTWLAAELAELRRRLGAWRPGT